MTEPAKKSMVTTVKSTGNTKPGLFFSSRMNLVADYSPHRAGAYFGPSKIVRVVVAVNKVKENLYSITVA